MTKVTLDMSTFKALASDTRLDILKCLDGKNMSLNDICRLTKLNKATLHEHLTKLHEAGLIKRNEREGHKWVYYKLTWKGEGLLHPENTKIVVMFSATFISLFIAVILLVNFAQPITVGMATTSNNGTTNIYEAEDTGIPLLMKTYNFNYIGSINATNQTVENVSDEFQNIAQVTNSIGAVYSSNALEWRSPTDLKYQSDQSIMSGDIKHNESINDSTEYNTKSGGLLGSYGDFLAPPAIPEMIATVQDITLLYYAIICLTLFGIAFTVSSWKLLKSRKAVF